VTSDAASVQGAWSFEEEVQLLRALEELKREGKSNQSARGFWVSVSKAMGDTRTPKQCRNKWCVLWCSSFIITTVMSFSGKETIKARSRLGMRVRPGAGKMWIVTF